MHVNVYENELTTIVEKIAKTKGDKTYAGIKFKTLCGSITFWNPKTLNAAINNYLELAAKGESHETSTPN